mgnify:CR=1 FL=1
MSSKRIIVKLKNSMGRFYDPQTKFRIKLKEEKELAYPLGDMTRQWLNAGGLVITTSLLKSPPDKPASILSETEQPELLSSVEQEIKPPRNDEYDYMSVQQLRKAAKDRGIKLARTDSAEKIRRKLRTS